MKKGFTLIELLAVIVILAIIAVIATPIVLSIIKDTKKSANVRSAENYIEAIELSLANNQLDTSTLEDGYYGINELDVSIKGKIPKDGWLYIKNNELVNYKLLMDKTIIEKHNNEITYDNSAPTSTVKLLHNEFGLGLSNDPNSYISKISLSYDETFKAYFYIEKSKVKDYNDLTLSIYNSILFKENLKEYSIMLNNYFKKENYIVFEYEFQPDFWFLLGNINIKLMDNNITQLTSFNCNMYDYFYQILYSNNITNKNNSILISLINMISAYQQTFSSYITSTDRRIYNSLLKENDINIDKLTDKSVNLINEASIINTDLNNNKMEELNAYFGTVSKNYNYELPFELNFYLRNDTLGSTTPSNTSLNEFEKYGIAFFDKDLVNSVASYDDLNNYLKQASVTYGNQSGYGKEYNSNIINIIELKINIEDLDETKYCKVIYKNNENEYYFGKLFEASIPLYLNYLLNKNSYPQLMKASLNFISEVTSN